jgi:hypothetical protein
MLEYPFQKSADTIPTSKDTTPTSEDTLLKNQTAMRNPPQVYSPPQVKRDPLRRDCEHRVVIQPRDLEIVVYLYRHLAATRRQIQRRFKLGVHGANRLLRRLYDVGLVERYQPVFPDCSAFSSQIIYCPGAGAAETLARHFNEDVSLVKRRCQKQPGYLMHTLEVTQFCLQFEEELVHERYTWEEVLIERYAIDSFEVRSSGSNWESMVVRPDVLVTGLNKPSQPLNTPLRSLLNSSFPPPTTSSSQPNSSFSQPNTSFSRWHLAIECDRGTVAAKPFQEKLHTYAVWSASGAMTGVHGKGQLAVLVQTHSEERADHLLGYAKDAGYAGGKNNVLFAVCSLEGQKKYLESQKIYFVKQQIGGNYKEQNKSIYQENDISRHVAGSLLNDPIWYTLDERKPIILNQKIIFP